VPGGGEIHDGAEIFAVAINRERRFARVFGGMAIALVHRSHSGY
jgi:hypothetical protein